MIKDKSREEYLDVKRTEKHTSTLINMIEKENIEIIELLLKNDKLNINEFYLATYINLKKGGTSTFQKKAALHYAIEKENIDIIKLLVANEKTDIHIISLSGAIEFVEKTPLIIAVELENIEIIEILLESKNIDIGYHSHFCKTALQIATEKKNDTIVNLLSTKENKT